MSNRQDMYMMQSLRYHYHYYCFIKLMIDIFHEFQRTDLLEQIPQQLRSFPKQKHPYIAYLLSKDVV